MWYTYIICHHTVNFSCLFAWSSYVFSLYRQSFGQFDSNSCRIPLKPCINQEWFCPKNGAVYIKFQRFIMTFFWANDTSFPAKFVYSCCLWNIACRGIRQYYPHKKLGAQNLFLGKPCQMPSCPGINPMVIFKCSTNRLVTWLLLHQSCSQQAGYIDERLGTVETTTPQDNESTNQLPSFVSPKMWENPRGLWAV